MSTAPRRVATALAALALTTGAALTAAAPASADAVPEWDHVDARVNGNAIVGDVYWSSYRYGAGTVTVYNDMNDGLCVNAQHRVMKGGVWSAWSTIVTLCSTPSYRIGVNTGPVGANVNYYQLRVVNSGSFVATDTNSPGGA